MKIMVKHGALLAFSALIGAGLLVLLIAIRHGDISEKEVGSAVLALFGTFVGASFAFRLNEAREEQHRHEKHRAALNKALFVIGRQVNAVENLKRDMEQYKNGINQAFNMPAFQPPPYPDLVHDFESLSFLLETEHTNILMLLSVEQEGFHQALESLRVRNEFYIRELQPSMSKFGLLGQRLLVEHLSEQLGERLYSGATQGARVAYESVQASVVGLGEMQEELLKVYKALYPKNKFVSYESVAGAA